jgi:hypothetical protein
MASQRMENALSERGESKGSFAKRSLRSRLRLAGRVNASVCEGCPP